MSLPALDFSEVETPATTVSRPTEPNPFEGKFPLPEGKALSVVLPSGTTTENSEGKAVKDDDAKALAKVVSFAQEAGRAVETTTRVKREPCDKNGKASEKGTHTRLTFWTVPQITRPRKGTENGDPAPSE